jgi:hypothetical protein
VASVSGEILVSPPYVAQRSTFECTVEDAAGAVGSETLPVTKGDVGSTIYEADIIVLVDYDYFERERTVNDPDSSGSVHRTLNITDEIMRRDLGVALKIARTIVYTSLEADPFADVSNNIDDAFRITSELWSRQRPPISLDVADGVLAYLRLGIPGDAPIGVAHIGGACDPVRGVAVMSTLLAGFSRNYQLAAHELGHLLGAHHDTNSDGTVDSRCPADTPGDAIMTGTGVELANPTRYSQCSIDSIREFVGSAECMMTIDETGVCGDANHDGKVTIRDAVEVLSQAIRGVYMASGDIAVRPPGYSQFILDYQMTAVDAMAILRAGIGLASEPLKCAISSVL